MMEISKVYKLSMAAIAASLVLVNCSGVDGLIGDDEEAYVPVSFTGQFVDTYVKGLNYTCTGWLDGVENQLTGTGVTNAEGKFTCNEGNVVEFSIGSYVIGSTRAYNNPIVTPYEIGLGGTEAIINIAQLLQTIDDKSIDGVLTIPGDFTALNGVTVTPQDSDFDALMAEKLNVPSLVSEEDAQAHLDETLNSLSGATTTSTPPETELSVLLAGKTVYIPHFDADAVAIWKFSADGTEVTVTEESTWIESIIFDGNTITVGTITTIEATNITADSINVMFTDGASVENLTLYFNRADAEAALLP